MARGWEVVGEEGRGMLLEKKGHVRKSAFNVTDRRVGPVVGLQVIVPSSKISSTLSVSCVTARET